MLANDFIIMPYSFTHQRPAGAARWGIAHKKFQREQYKHFIRVVGPVQEMPVFDNRVMLDPQKRDYWGIPLLRTSGTKHPHDAEIGQFIAGKAEQLLQEVGAKSIQRSAPSPASRRSAGGGQHQAGTCRMGDDPKSSVTNRYGQLHGIDNLFVADGSLNVTNGGFNPVLTIMALGFWVGEYIAREWRGGGRFRT